MPEPLWSYRTGRGHIAPRGGLIFITYVFGLLSPYRICGIFFDRRVGRSWSNRRLHAIFRRSRTPGSRVGVIENLLVHDVPVDRPGFQIAAHHPDALEGFRPVRAIHDRPVHGVFRDLAALGADRVITPGYRELNDGVATHYLSAHDDRVL